MAKKPATKAGTKTLFVSTSFGATSGLMAHEIQQRYATRKPICGIVFDEVYYLFANTSLEHEETLIFGKKLTDVFGIPVIWLEAVIDPRKGHGVRHKVVTFETASRKGEPMLAHAAKEGIPGPTNRKCSDRLKYNVMGSYCRSLGYKKREGYTAIGFRVDEIDRMNPKYKQEKLLYPLISDFPMTKEMVYRWWQKQPFKLNLESHYGNCVGCYQKTDRKLWTIALEHPEYFEPIIEMENKYAHIKSVGEVFDDGGRRKFYRDERTAKDIIAQANESRFTPYVDNPTSVYTPDMFGDTLNDIDRGGDCDGGCVVNKAL